MCGIYYPGIEMPMVAKAAAAAAAAAPAHVAATPMREKEIRNRTSS